MTFEPLSKQPISDLHGLEQLAGFRLSQDVALQKELRRANQQNLVINMFESSNAVSGSNAQKSHETCSGARSGRRVWPQQTFPTRQFAIVNKLLPRWNVMIDVPFRAEVNIFSQPSFRCTMFSGQHRIMNRSSRIVIDLRSQLKLCVFVSLLEAARQSIRNERRNREKKNQATAAGSA